MQFYTDYPHKYEIRYCEEDDQYWIRGEVPCNKKSKAKFIIKLNYPEAGLKFDPEVFALYERCRDFTAPEKELIQPKNLDAEPMLDWRYEHQVGSCGNRMFVFFHNMKRMGKLKKYPCDRMWFNDAPHAFPEIDAGDGYRLLELGGYPGPHEEPIQQDQMHPKVRQLPPPKNDSATSDEDDSAEEMDASSDEEQLSEESTSSSDEQSSEESSSKKSVSDKEAELEESSEEALPNVLDAFKPEVPNPKAPLSSVTEASLHPGFITWNVKKAPENLPLQKIFLMMNGAGKNTLLKVDNTDDFNLIIATYAKNNRKPFLVIDAPDDLQWSLAGLKMFGNHKLKITQKFSRLRDFVEKHPDGMVFINLSKFAKRDLVAMHSIFDEKRILEGEAFPAGNPLSGVYNTKVPTAYRGDDLYSRFDHKVSWQHLLLDNLYADRCKRAAVPAGAALVKNLYASDDWEALLFGLINVKDHQFTLHEAGFLETGDHAIITTKHLHLINPPWHSRDFQLFWQSALQQGWFNLYGKKYSLSADFQLTYSENLTFARQCICAEAASDAPSFVLNSQTHTNLFSHYVLNAKDEFESCKGFFAAHAGQVVHLKVVDTLTSVQWAQLLDEAATFRVQIALSLLPSVSLPAELNSVPRSSIPLVEQETAGCDVIYAKNNADDVVTGLRKKYPDAIYVRLDRTHEFSDFFYEIDAKVIDLRIALKEALTMISQAQMPHHMKIMLATFFISCIAAKGADQSEIYARLLESDLWIALQKGATIIIEGEIPKIMQDMLAELFVSGKQELVIQGRRVPFKGKLFFVTPQPVPGAVHQKTLPDTPAKSVSKPKLKIMAAPKENKDLSLAACLAYEGRRFTNIYDGLNQPFPIFYTGTTGIGKTTYFTSGTFEKEYKAKTGRKVRLYIGEGQLEAYAQHGDANVDAIPIIDEANLSSQPLSPLKSWQAGHLLMNRHY